MPKGIYLPKGSSFYWISFADSNGIRRRESSKATTLAEARNIREDRLAGIRSGKLVFDNTKRKQVILFRDFVQAAILLRATSKYGGYTAEDIETFLGTDSPKLCALRNELVAVKRKGGRPRFKFKATQTYMTRIKSVLAYFGGMNLLSINPDTVTRFIQNRMGEKVSGATINRELTTISNIYNWGMDAREFRELKLINPYRSRLHKRREADPIVRYWSREEREAYLRGCAELSGQLVLPAEIISGISVTAWTVGMRIDEILGLKVGQVRFDIGRVELKGYQTKNGKPRSVQFFTDRVKAIFERNCRDKKSDEFVFQSKGRDIDNFAFERAFQKVVAKAGIKDVNIHSFRKTAAIDLMVYRSKDAIAVMAILGHQDFKTSLRYADPSLIEELRSQESEKGHDLVKVA